jgi:concanavalin A-like lectin/glucanase superfamily protein
MGAVFAPTRMTMRAVLALVFVLAASGCFLAISADDYTKGDREDLPDGASPPPDGATAGDASVGGDSAPTSIPDLIGSWSFDEGMGTVAHDATPRANDGTLKGTAAWADGRIGRALAFDGTTSRVEVPRHPSLAVTTAFTVAMWVNLDVVTYDERIFADGYSFGIKINNRKPQLELGGRYAIGAYAIPVNEWHHIAVTFDKGQVIWSIDGLPIALAENTFTGGDVPVADTYALEIGTRPEHTDVTKGRLDEVQFYSRALSAQEIAKIALAP